MVDLLFDRLVFGGGLWGPPLVTHCVIARNMMQCVINVKPSNSIGWKKIFPERNAPKTDGNNSAHAPTMAVGVEMISEETIPATACRKITAVFGFTNECVI
jgi:hypothetical protein